MRRLFILALGLSVSTAALSQARSGVADHAFGVSRPIAGQYIVVFHDRVVQPTALAAQLARQSGAEVIHTYGTAIKGFAARMSESAAGALANNPNVAFVERDQTVSLNETVSSPPVAQSPATWGLDRADQRALPLNSSYRYEYTGLGVYAFVIDTGILSAHQEFGGRVDTLKGYSAIADGRGTADCNGHGTHVAGTVGGSTYGVAKQVTLVPIRVLDCNGSGSYSGVIAGIDHVANSDARPAVANLSLGGGYSAAVNTAVAGAVGKNVTMVVAAGNSNANACSYSPASEPSALTVGATTSTDARASYSNFGSCVDLFAPGSGITSAWYTSTTATNTISGTSMASPHAAGVAALLLAGGAASPTAVATAMINQSTPGLVTSAGTDSPNRLLFSMASEPVSVSQTVAVSAISSRGVTSGKNWKATATVTIKARTTSDFGAVIAGATVNGAFAPGGSASCVTGSTGSCTLTSAVISRSLTSSTLSVTGVAGSGLAYDSAGNAATMVTISKP